MEDFIQGNGTGIPGNPGSCSTICQPLVIHGILINPRKIITEKLKNPIFPPAGAPTPSPGQREGQGRTHLARRTAEGVELPGGAAFISPRKGRCLRIKLGDQNLSQPEPAPLPPPGPQSKSGRDSLLSRLRGTGCFSRGAHPGLLIAANPSGVGNLSRLLGSHFGTMRLMKYPSFITNIPGIPAIPGADHSWKCWERSRSRQDFPGDLVIPVPRENGKTPVMDRDEDAPESGDSRRRGAPLAPPRHSLDPQRFGFLGKNLRCRFLISPPIFLGISAPSVGWFALIPETFSTPPRCPKSRAWARKFHGGIPGADPSLPHPFFGNFCSCFVSQGVTSWCHPLVSPPGVDSQGRKEEPAPRLPTCPLKRRFGNRVGSDFSIPRHGNGVASTEPEVKKATGTTWDTRFLGFPALKYRESPGENARERPRCVADGSAPCFPSGTAASAPQRPPGAVWGSAGAGAGLQAHGLARLHALGAANLVLALLHALGDAGLGALGGADVHALRGAAGGLADLDALRGAAGGTLGGTNVHALRGAAGGTLGGTNIHALRGAAGGALGGTNIHALRGAAGGTLGGTNIHALRGAAGGLADLDALRGAGLRALGALLQADGRRQAGLLALLVVVGHPGEVSVGSCSAEERNVRKSRLCPGFLQLEGTHKDLIKSNSSGNGPSRHFECRGPGQSQGFYGINAARESLPSLGTY
ncbi:hypothetical protein DV515_00016233 [Chloebia gouldiae]|uniref:Uncharacterized protein n=1 Tax=Chloebia gouldiae TaxID=44316 RepID=A0A3L8RUJ2_CHLGU|nr:hypothetical protein DV515_00016233 [Chloebia gouldiae]